MNDEEEISIIQFLYYSIIFFIVVLFFTIIIDVIANKIFPKERHTYVLVEIFTIWILLSVMLFYSKKIIFSIPNPFTNSVLKKNNFNITLIIVLIPIVIGCGIQNMRNKTKYLYDDIEHFFN